MGKKLEYEKCELKINYRKWEHLGIDYLGVMQINENTIPTVKQFMNLGSTVQENS
jgi:hypothetical protein